MIDSSGFGWAFYLNLLCMAEEWVARGEMMMLPKKNAANSREKNILYQSKIDLQSWWEGGEGKTHALSALYDDF